MFGAIRPTGERTTWVFGPDARVFMAGGFGLESGQGVL